MWLTPLGERTLRDAEARLFREGLGCVLGLIGSDWDVRLGESAFDRLGFGQRLVALEVVGRQLLDEDSESPPEATAVLEAAIASVFNTIHNEVMLEIKTARPADCRTKWRQLLLDAVSQADYPSDYPLPDPKCSLTEEWRLMLGHMLERIVLEKDWPLFDWWEAANSERVCGINTAELDGGDAYFARVPDEPTTEEMLTLGMNLERMTSTPNSPGTEG